MKKKLYACLFSALAFGALNVLNAQKADALYLLSGKIETQQDFDAKKMTPEPAEIVDGQYFRLVQFNRMPSPKEREALANQGAQFLYYMPSQAFVLALKKDFPTEKLAEYGAKTVHILRGIDKMSLDVLEGNYPAYASRGGQAYALWVKPYDNFTPERTLELFKIHGVPVVNRHEFTGAYEVVVERSNIARVASLPWVKFVDFVEPPVERDDIKGRTLTRSNLLTSNGLNFDGSGETIAFGDDGPVGPHIDFQGRLTLVDATSLDPANDINHADMTAGCAAAAGNLNPLVRGTAPGANVLSYHINGYRQISEAITNSATRSIFITSTSYSQGCNRYDNLASQIDFQVFNNPKLIHCFSGGNNASANCSYGGGAGIAGWGNITGGMKLGKNVIAVGNIDTFDIINSTSSRGPTIDGRIKPDICATGNGQVSTSANNTYQAASGTSAAAPTFAGTVAQISQAYRALNGEQRPDVAFIKGLLMNTADDVGLPGPDFTYGWGRVNAWRAYQAMKNNQFVKGSFTATDTLRTIPLSIPSGTSRVKVMVYWSDVEGAPNSARALVNDLDMTITDGQGNTFQPWLLNLAAVADSLRKPAITGEDHRNNVEQIQIDNPSVAQMTINIKPFQLVSAKLDYYVFFDFIKDTVEIVSPNGGESVVPGESEIVRWDALGDNGPFLLEYSVDNGVSWEAIRTDVPGSRRHWTWMVPDQVTAKALVRVSRNGKSDVSHANFTIGRTPRNLRMLYVCGDTTTITWDSVPRAIGYEISRLGAKYMDSIGRTTNLAFKIPVRAEDSAHFSVKALFPDGGVGRRAIAVAKPRRVTVCPSNRDIEAVRVNQAPNNSIFTCNDSLNRRIALTVRNYGFTNIDSFTVSYQLNTQPVETYRVNQRIALFGEFTYTFPNRIQFSTPGDYRLRVWATINGDEVRRNDTLTYNFLVSDKNPIPLVENFEGTSFPPRGWALGSSIANPVTWEQVSGITGSNGQPTRAAMFNNIIATRNTQDHLTTWLLDLKGVQKPLLTFDVSYAVRLTSRLNGLRVAVMTNCGQTQNLTSYFKRSTGLATVSTIASNWTPTEASHWRRDTVDLVDYRDSVIAVRFINMGDGDSKLYLDNINLVNNVNTSSSDPLSVPMLAAFPNPSATGIFDLNLKNFDANNVTYRVVDVSGRVVTTKKLGAVRGDLLEKVDLSGQAQGVYLLHIQSDERSYQIKLSVWK